MYMEFEYNLLKRYNMMPTLNVMTDVYGSVNASTQIQKLLFGLQNELPWHNSANLAYLNNTR